MLKQIVSFQVITSYNSHVAFTVLIFPRALPSKKAETVCFIYIIYNIKLIFNFYRRGLRAGISIDSFTTDSFGSVRSGQGSITNDGLGCG